MENKLYLYITRSMKSHLKFESFHVTPSNLFSIKTSTLCNVHDDARFWYICLNRLRSVIPHKVDSVAGSRDVDCPHIYIV